MEVSFLLEETGVGGERKKKPVAIISFFLSISYGIFYNG
jgi:hypothetical protein